MKDSRIGVMYLTTAPFPGGALYGLRSIVRELDRRRFRPVVVLPEGKPELADFFRGADVELATLPIALFSRRSPSVLLDWLRSAMCLARLVRKHDIRILHSTSPRAALLGPLVRWLSGVRFVWQIAMLGQPWTLHFLARFADAAPCVSRAVYEEFGARANMQVVLNGPWTEELSRDQRRARRRDLRRELGIAEDALVVGSVANVQRWKGIHTLLEAFARVAQELPEASLVHLGGRVAGYESYAREIESQIAALGLGERICRMGYREDAYRYYPVFDVFVHAPVPEGPHRCTEAFGHSVAEAMGYRLPVIASRLGGPAEIVEEGVTGELIAPGNAAELAEKLLALLRDPERRRRMGEAGYARYRQQFTIEREVADYQRLYEELLSPARVNLRRAPGERRFDFRPHWRRVLAENGFAQRVRLGEVGHRCFVEQLARALGGAARDPVRVLEVGAGSATGLRLLAQRFSGTLCALDILPEAVDVARRASRNGPGLSIQLVVADVFRAPFPSESFDLVFSQGLVEHFANPSEIFAAQARLVKPEGCLVVSVPQRFNLYTLYKHRRMRRGRWEPGWETEYSAGQLAWLGRCCGLEVQEINGHGSFLCAVVVRLVRRVASPSVAGSVVRAFDAADALLGERLRAALCQNVVVTFRKVPGAPAREISCRN